MANEENPRVGRQLQQLPLVRFWSIGVALLSVAVTAGWTALRLGLPTDGYRCTITSVPAHSCEVRQDLVAHRSTVTDEGLRVGDTIIKFSKRCIANRTT